MAPSGKTLDVVTLNIWGLPDLLTKPRQETGALASAWVKKEDRVTTIIAKYFCEDSPDIIALQEVWAEADVKRFQNAAGRLGMESHHFSSGMVGSGLLVCTRFHIERAMFKPFSVNGTPVNVAHGDWYAGKGVGFLELRGSDSFHLKVYVTHLHAQYDMRYDQYAEQRLAQVIEMAEFIRVTGVDRPKGWRVPVMALGDFNMSPDQITYEAFKAYSGLRDTYCDYGLEQECLAYTIPDDNGEPRRIDYIFFDPGLSSSTPQGNDSSCLIPQSRAVEACDWHTDRLAGNPDAAALISDHFAVRVKFTRDVTSVVQRWAERPVPNTSLNERVNNTLTSYIDDNTHSGRSFHESPILGGPIFGFQPHYSVLIYWTVFYILMHSIGLSFLIPLKVYWELAVIIFVARAAHTRMTNAAMRSLVLCQPWTEPTYGLAQYEQGNRQ